MSAHADDVDAVLGVRLGHEDGPGSGSLDDRLQAPTEPQPLAAATGGELLGPPWLEDERRRQYDAGQLGDLEWELRNESACAL